jgi:uncharacterized protein YodC (DUF2158 family)
MPSKTIVAQECFPAMVFGNFSSNSTTGMVEAQWYSVLAAKALKERPLD